VIAARDGEAAKAAAEAIEKDFGTTAVGMATDVGVREQVYAMVNDTVARFGKLDVLVNNASLLSPNVLLEHKTDAMLQKTLEVGLWANWWSMQAAFPHMKAAGGGAIVNFSSIDAQIGSWLHGDYNMGKLGIVGLTRTAAVEWGRFGIRANVIAPTGKGQVFAELIDKLPDFEAMVTQSNPLLRMGDPEEDIGPVVVFLASEMSRFITGEMINVDGGQHLPGFVSKPHNLAELEGSA
jgi:NAD(P)-dependent dehydrogenase (short-subunit alcohol dehydrogenase family)